MNVPYKTSTGIQIGKYYQKPIRIEDDPDMIYWQSVLLNQHIPFRIVVLKAIYIVACVVGVILLLANN